MAVELTPKGTRGLKIPKLPRPLMKAVLAIQSTLMRQRGVALFDLTTVGAKSGRQHTVPLRYFPAGANAWLIVASFAGAIQHPARYVNMARNPDQVWITIEGRKVRVQPDSLNGAEREDAWQRIVQEARVMAAIRRKLTGRSRSCGCGRWRQAEKRFLPEPDMAGYPRMAVASTVSPGKAGEVNVSPGATRRICW